MFHTLAVSVNPVDTFSGFAFGGEEKRIEGMMADLRRCRAVFLLSLLLVQLVAASTEQVISQTFDCQTDLYDGNHDPVPQIGDLCFCSR